MRAKQLFSSWQHHEHDFVEVLDGDAVGPFEEDGAARLKCVVQGGRPYSNVTWWSGRGEDERGEFLLQYSNSIESWLSVKVKQLARFC